MIFKNLPTFIHFSTITNCKTFSLFLQEDLEDQCEEVRGDEEDE